MRDNWLDDRANHESSVAMNRTKKLLLCTFFFLVTQGTFPFSQTAAMACPSCKAANEADTRLPTAYMYSILFMLAMPATVFTGFGISFYRLSQKSRREHEASLAANLEQAKDSDSTEHQISG